VPLVKLIDQTSLSFASNPDNPRRMISPHTKRSGTRIVNQIVRLLDSLSIGFSLEPEPLYFRFLHVRFLGGSTLTAPNDLSPSLTPPTSHPFTSSRGWPMVRSQQRRSQCISCLPCTTTWICKEPLSCFSRTPRYDQSGCRMRNSHTNYFQSAATIASTAAPYTTLLIRMAIIWPPLFWKPHGNWQYRNILSGITAFAQFTIGIGPQSVHTAKGKQVKKYFGTLAFFVGLDRQTDLIRLCNCAVNNIQDTQSRQHLRLLKQSNHSYYVDSLISVIRQTVFLTRQSKQLNYFFKR